MKTTFTERFFEAWENLDEYQQLSVYNEYAYACGYEPIISMDEFDGVMRGYEPMQVALCMHFGNFNPTHKWFRFDGYANLESEYFLNEWLDDATIGDLATWYEDNRSAMVCACDDMLEIYDKDEDEDEDEER